MYTPKILTVFFLLMIVSITLFATKIESQFFLQNDLAKAILQDEPELIQSYQDGKLYLNKDIISFGNEGILLKTTEKSFVLPVLFSDAHGCYLPIIDPGIVTTCNNCGYVFEITELVTYCPNCGYGQWPK